MGIGRNGITAHGFRANTQGQLPSPQRNMICRLQDHLDPGAANALNKMCRAIHRHTGIKPDMARRHIGIKRGLRHRTRHGKIDIRRHHPDMVNSGTRGLDAQIYRRDFAKCAGIINKWRPLTAQQPHIVKVRSQSFYDPGHVIVPFAQSSHGPAPVRDKDRRPYRPDWSTRPAD